MIISVLDLLHHSCSVLEAYLVGSPHLSSGGIDHAVEELVESCELYFGQRLLERDSSLFSLIREMAGFDSTKPAV